MVLKFHEPEAAMSGQIIRISNKDRPTSWITFHFESENDAAQEHKRPICSSSSIMARSSTGTLKA